MSKPTQVDVTFMMSSAPSYVDEQLADKPIAQRAFRAIMREVANLQRLEVERDALFDCVWGIHGSGLLPESATSVIDDMEWPRAREREWSAAIPYIIPEEGES